MERIYFEKWLKFTQTKKYNRWCEENEDSLIKEYDKWCEEHINPDLFYFENYKAWCTY
jgi:hypothetical protein